MPLSNWRAQWTAPNHLIVKALEAYLAEYADHQIALDRLRDKEDPVLSSAELRKRLARKN